jgi:hypothetical protein
MTFGAKSFVKAILLVSEIWRFYHYRKKVCEPVLSEENLAVDFF